MSVRWIDSRLGTAPWSATAPDPGHEVVDVRALLDRAGNDLAELKRKIAEAERHLRQGRRVIICCDHGVSRSNAVAAAVLSRADDIEFEVALDRVLAATGETGVKLGVLADVRAALGVDLGGARATRKASAILVTGGQGFVGRTVRTALANAPALEDESLSSATRLERAVSASGARCLVHLARPALQDTNEGLSEALRCLGNILDVCHTLGARLVFLSGHQIFSGYRGPWLHATETLPPRPSGPLGEALYLSETLIDHRRQLTGLEALVVRSCMLYGDGDERVGLLSSFIHRALHGHEIVVHRYRGGLPLVELLHVRDFAAGLAAAITRELTGYMHLGAGSGIDTPSLATRISELAGQGSAVRTLDLPGDPSNIILDSAQAHSKLGWSPKISLEYGLSELVAARKAEMGRPSCIRNPA